MDQPAPRYRPEPPEALSTPAREFLSRPDFPSPPFPEIGDTDGWLAFTDAVNTAVRPMYEAGLPPADTYTRSTFEIDGTTTHVITPASLVDDGETPIFIDAHGGALYLGGGELAWIQAVPDAVGRDGITWAPDYRVPPLHPYPAALEDMLALYRRALEVRSPDRILVSGNSAGGNLAAALLLRARDEGLPMPAALVLRSPEADLTESGDSFRTLAGIDNVLASLEVPNRLYAAGADLTDPYVSPLFGDPKGFPPTLLQSGTRDLFLSNTVRLHRRLLAAGVEAELHVFEAMPHGGFGGTTLEDADLHATVRTFEARHLAG
ncbi:alpha/beta hydrolase [Tessaracoccus terricola]